VINSSHIVGGLAFGVTYGLLAMGLVLIYRTSRVLNFAHGQLGVVAAVLLQKFVLDFHFPYLVALPLVLVVAVVVGGGSELVLRRLYDRPRLLVMVATIGLSQVLFLAALLPFVRPKKTFLYPVPFHLHVAIGSYDVPEAFAVALIVAPLVAIAVAAFFRFTTYGLQMRAIAENADSARLAGVFVRRTSTMAWMLAGLLSAFTAFLLLPMQGATNSIPLAPDTLLRALAAALIAGMVSLTGAFIAGITVGLVEGIANAYGHLQTSTVTMVLFLLLLAVLAIRARRLRRAGVLEERSSFKVTSRERRGEQDETRVMVGRVGVGLALAAALVLPALVGPGRNLLLGRIVVFALIALSLTILSGWAGQISLGHMALVAVGLVMGVRLSGSVPLPLLLLYAGLLAAALAVVVGLPALRIPGLFLAVTTLGLAVVMQVAVLSTPCTTLPIVRVHTCLGFPPSIDTLVRRPQLFGVTLGGGRATTYFALVVLVLALLAMLAWRDSGVARLLIAVRDNEPAAAAMGVRVVRAKLAAFALSGFLAGVAGVVYALVQQRPSVALLDAPQSFLVVAMVVIGGLGSISGAMLGAVYLIGLPAAFGSTPTVQFLTSGIGLLAFLLYLPGGLGSLLTKAADALATLLRRLDQPRGFVDLDEPEPAVAAR
jgi:ABC-type branched-subunit amino acid transport system permease subunit